MLNITGLHRFFLVRDFYDMRCKYDEVLSIIHQQLNREPEDGDVFIVMSKDLRLVRLFSYDQRLAAYLRNVLGSVISLCKSLIAAMKGFIKSIGRI